MPARERLTGYRIGDVTVDLVNRRIDRQGMELSCGRLTFDLLTLLAKKAPDIVGRDELVDSIWGGRYVHPATIKQRVSLLRHALGDRADNPDYIRVFRGEGYALIPQVQPLYSRSFDLAPWQRFGIAAGLLLLTFVTGAEIGYRDGTKPRVPGLNASMSIVLASWPITFDDEFASEFGDDATFGHELPAEDYPFVMGMASQVLDVLTERNLGTRLSEIQRYGDETDEASLTVIANATTNDADQISIRFTVLNEGINDDRLARAYFREAWTRRITQIVASQPGAVVLTTAGSGQPQPVSVPDSPVAFVAEGRPENRNFVLTADFVFGRVEIREDPRAIQMDAVQTIAMAVDERLPDLGMRDPFARPFR